MVGHIQSNADTIQAAKEKVGEEAFASQCEARVFEDWPKRYDLDSDRHYGEKVQNHKNLVALDVAREILAQ